MLRKARIILFLFFGLLTALLIWRAFVYNPPLPDPLEQPPPVVPPTQEALNQSDLILDLFNPTDTMLAAQITEATLTRQIEEALIISFLLRRCEYLSYDEYSDTYRALVAYAYQTHLAPSMDAAQARVKSIVESANGSYALIYSRTACNAPELGPAKTKLLQWRDSVLKD